MPYRPFDDDRVVLNELRNNSFFAIRYVDLTGISSVLISVGSGDKFFRFAGGHIELHLDSPEGPLAGQVTVEAKNNAGKMQFSDIRLPLTIDPGDKFHDLYFVVKSDNNDTQPVTAVDWVRFVLSKPEQ